MGKLLLIIGYCLIFIIQFSVGASSSYSSEKMEEILALRTAMIMAANETQSEIVQILNEAENNPVIYKVLETHLQQKSQKCYNYVLENSKRSNSRVFTALEQFEEILLEKTLVPITKFIKNVIDCASQRSIDGISMESYQFITERVSVSVQRIDDTITALQDITRDLENFYRNIPKHIKRCLNLQRLQRFHKTDQTASVVLCLENIASRLTSECLIYTNTVSAQEKYVGVYAKQEGEFLRSYITEKVIEINNNLLKEKNFDVKSCKKN